MLYVLIDGDRVPVPRDVETQGPKAVQAFIDNQRRRVEAEAAPRAKTRKKGVSDGGAEAS